MEQVVSKSVGQQVEQAMPTLQEIDRLKLERLNLSISNLNLQLALLNERARALQIEMAGFQAEKEGLVKALNHKSSGWILNPNTMIFEACDVGARLAPAQKEDKDGKVV